MVGNISSLIQHEWDDPKSCLSVFFDTLQQNSYSKWSINQPAPNSKCMGIQAKQKQFPFHGRAALSCPHTSPVKLTLILAFWLPITAVLSRSLLWSPACGPSAAPSLTLHLLSQCLYLLCPCSPSVPTAPPQPPLYQVPSLPQASS